MHETECSYKDRPVSRQEPKCPRTFKVGLMEHTLSTRLTFELGETFGVTSQGSFLNIEPVVPLGIPFEMSTNAAANCLRCGTTKNFARRYETCRVENARYLPWQDPDLLTCDLAAKACREIRNTFGPRFTSPPGGPLLKVIGHPTHDAMGRAEWQLIVSHKEVGKFGQGNSATLATDPSTFLVDGQ